MYDGLGREYDVGDNIVYAMTVGKSAQMVIGRVEEVQWTDAKGESLTPYWPRNGPAAPVFRLKVQPLSFPTGGGSWRRSRYVPFDERPEGGPAFVPAKPRTVILTRITNVLRWDGAAGEEER